MGLKSMQSEIVRFIHAHPHIRRIFSMKNNQTFTSWPDAHLLLSKYELEVGSVDSQDLEHIEDREDEVKQCMAKVADEIVQGGICCHRHGQEGGIAREGLREHFGGPVHVTGRNVHMSCHSTLISINVMMLP